MGQALRVGVMSSAFLLACNHERVDLGGSGAGGSILTPSAGSAVEAAVPEPSDTPLLSPVPESRPIRPPEPTPPPFAAVPTLPHLVPPISGGTLAVAVDGSVAVAADPDRDLVYLVDIAADDTRIVALPRGSNPGRVVLDDRGQAHVLLRTSGQLARIEHSTTHAVLSEPVCQHPRGLAFSAKNGSVHVACAGGQLVQLSAATHELLLRTQSPFVDLRDVVIAASGKLVVSRFRDASFLLPERDATEITLPALPWPVLEVDHADTEPARWVSTRATFAFRTVSAPDGTVWMLHERAQIDPLDADDFRGMNTHCGPAVQAALTQLDPETGSIQSSLQLQGVPAPAVDLAISATGTWLALAAPSAFAGRRAGVQLYRAATLSNEAHIERQVNAEFPDSPALLCASPSHTGYILDTQAVAVAFDGNDVLYVQGRNPAYLHIISTATGAGGERILVMNDAPPRDLGHEWFHAELADSRVSCAACHAEGLDDAHVWRSSKGPRRTPNLRGGLSETAPFAWDGEHISLNSIISSYADASVPAEAISSIGGWLDKLGPLALKPTSEADKRAAESGKALFESAQLGCNLCHSGPKLTNNQTVDVGTGGAFQVPSLLGLGLRAPYMHDGCAKELHTLFTSPDCIGHGHVQLTTLDDQQAAEVEAYLRSL